MSDHPARDLGPVIDSEMCVGCGACLMADPELDLVLDPDSLCYRPTTVGNPAAAAVCPAIEVDFTRLHQFVFPDSQVGAHGVVEKVVLAQSTDEARNLAASSGGLIKEMLHSLLSRDDIDGVIALDEVSGLDYRMRLVTRPEEIDQLPGSIYHAVRLDDGLRLLEDRPGRYVVVGIPCQLEGMYNYISQLRPDLMERVAMTVGLLCGWLYSHHAVNAIAKFKRFNPADINHVAYRGGGPVGKLRIVTPERELAIGRRVSFDYQVAFDRSFNTARCHLCINHSNFLADVVVGDAWLPSTVTTRTGISLVICRTAQSVEVLDSLAEQGRIVLTDGAVDDVTQSQTGRVVFGDFAYAYADYLGSIGAHRPIMVGPNRIEERLRPRAEAAKFAKELTRKRGLQRQRRYRYLWLRKATKELPKHLKRYVVWFFVRVLRVKTLLGQRSEPSRDEMAAFR
jgi:coenzyme F420 hydrogenase subunit beta